MFSGLPKNRVYRTRLDNSTVVDVAVGHDILPVISTSCTVHSASLTVNDVVLSRVTSTVVCNVPVLLGGFVSAC